ncbi:MAG: 4-hydroxythreonine-4-phosphate dehydrogenase PdxA [Deltaproteobacteria bacterium]|nr:4-hydroxythreonine-4-phosphate dehydrogenase PdxA [Deltaproteobacteria bacterium]MBW1951072.1 4-hydroxythreonine-4-phosphate dehydrogenase PdxA [Deltaproteobacteria bacterium]MBW2009583.1 4-hydroxythreonine-4-phosphate dehydrogenase PdxA [Deltaproteobacteria bacterium]
MEITALTKSPLIGITMGDPAGIGPEIIAEALLDPEIRSRCRPLVLGDPDVMAERIRRPGSGCGLRILDDPRGADPSPACIDLLCLSNLGGGKIVPGRPCVEGGRAMMAYILRAVELAMAGVLDAVVTAPISKRLMKEAGYPFEGHTQLLAHLTKTRKVVMMLAGARLRVSLVTIHLALKDVAGILTEEAVYDTIVMTAGALRDDFGIPRPRVAVAALNPHAGEEGLFGREESRFIAPAVRRARGREYAVEGPFPADTLFHKAACGAYDAVVAMYHDQGLIPLKLLHFSDAVNVTLGLPIIRTSVDHGTAYDIAGKGIADPCSLKAAVFMAAEMALRRRDARQGRSGGGRC